MSGSKKDIHEKLLRIGIVEELVGLKRTSLYGRIKEGTFPAPVKLSPRRSVWPKSQIDDWMQKMISEKQIR